MSGCRQRQVLQFVQAEAQERLLEGGQVQVLEVQVRRQVLRVFRQGTDLLPRLFLH